MKKWIEKLPPRKIRLIWTVLVLMVLSASFVNFLFVMIFNVAANDQCAWRPIPGNNQALLITDIVKSGVADAAGLQEGDTLLQINGKAVTLGGAQAIINAVPSGGYATYVIGRSSGRIEKSVQILRVFNVAYLGLVCVGLGFLIVGYIVVMTKPQGATQRLFGQYSLAAMLLFSFFGTQQVVPGQVFVTTLLLTGRIAGFVLAPPLFLRFFFHFPVPRPAFNRRWVTVLLYTVSCVSLAGAAFSQALALPPGLRTLLFFVPYIAYVSGLGVFVHSYFTLVEPSRRHQLRPVLYGIALGGAAALYLVTLSVINPFALFLSPTLFAPGLLLVAVPIGFGYSIFRYRLMDIDLLVKRSLIYATVTASIAAIYLLTVYGAGNLIAYFIGSEDNRALNAAALVLIALLFDPIKRRAQEWVDRSFYRERRNYQRALLEFSRELPRQMNLEQILSSMVATISDTMHVQRVAVIICNDTEGCFSVQKNIAAECCRFDQHAGGLMELLKSTRTPQSLGLIGEEMDSPIRNEDRGNILSAGVVLAVPMFLKDRLVGSINVGPKMSGSVYSQEDIDLLSTVGSQAAIAIENARLYQAEIEKQKIEDEIRLAWKIQQGLLPKSNPKIPGLDISGTTIPARTVGGDYFDFIQLGPGKILIVVADVAGKGMSAALYMSKVQGMVQLAAQMYGSPRDILVHVNRRLYDGIERKSFITMILALFDTERREVLLCRAGHNKALVAAGGTLSYLDAHGIGLGLERGAVFESELEEVKRPLGKDGLFVFYSDGLTEAMDQHNVQLGEESVCEVVAQNRSRPAGEIQELILRRVREFQGSAEQHDDLTLVVVKTTAE